MVFGVFMFLGEFIFKCAKTTGSRSQKSDFYKANQIRQVLNW